MIVVFQLRLCVADVGPWYYGPQVVNPLTAPRGQYPIGPFSTKTQARRHAKTKGHKPLPLPCFFSVDAIMDSPANQRWLAI